MKKLSATLLVFFTVSVLIVSCKKEDAPAQQTLALIKNKIWKITAASVNPSYYGMTNVYAGIEDCSRDNNYRFDAPDIFVIDEGSTKCYDTAPQTKYGNWTYDEATKTLTTAIDGTQDVFTIVTINQSQFICTSTIVEGGTTYHFTWTFTAA